MLTKKNLPIYLDIKNTPVHQWGLCVASYRGRESASTKTQKADTWPAADGEFHRRTERFELSMSWFSTQNKGFHSETSKPGISFKSNPLQMDFWEVRGHGTNAIHNERCSASAIFLECHVTAPAASCDLENAASIAI